MKASLKIAIDARHVQNFGIGTYIRNLSAALGRIDRQNEYVLAGHPSSADQLAGLPPNFRFVPYSHVDSESVDHVAFPAFLRRLRADVHHITLNRVPLFMCRPYVVTVHDMGRQLIEETGFRNQVGLYRARRGLQRAASVITPSTATRRSIESVLGIPHERIRTIPNAPDPRFLSCAYSQGADQKEAARQERERTLERYQIRYPYILYAGSVKPRKNLPRLMEAFAVLKGELGGHPEYADLRLVIVGADVSQNPMVRRAATQSRLGNAVRFLGHVPFETLRIFYECAAAFAFPSLHEGFGLPPLEAMACGTPVVASNVSSLPEVVGDAAVLVSPDNVFEIARGLREIVVDSALRATMIERGYQQVMRFSWERTAAQVLDAYREAASTSSSRK